MKKSRKGPRKVFIHKCSPRMHHVAAGLRGRYFPKLKGKIVVAYQTLSKWHFGWSNIITRGSKTLPAKRGTMLIVLNRRWLWHPLLTKHTLIHEMAHHSGGGHHGKQWQQEMLRIARMGIFRKIW